MYKALLAPFKEADELDSGVLPFNTFARICKDLGVALTHQVKGEFCIYILHLY